MNESARNYRQKFGAWPDPICDQILPGLFLGPIEAEQSDLSSLQKLGITHVLRLGCAFYPKSHEGELTYLAVETFDLPESDLLRLIKEQDCFGFIETGREAGGVLVHCVAGVSRSVTVVTSYIMCKQHLGFQQALGLVKAKRPRANPNSGFREQLKCLEEECNCDINKYTFAPTPPERAATDKQWLAHRQVAENALSPRAETPWRARRTNPVLPPSEDS